MPTTKCVFSLNIGNFAPEITRFTFPLMRHYARKIGAEFRVITERKFANDFPIPYEKLQIHKLGRDYDWSVFFDADTLVHPETIDFTEFLPPDTVAHNGKDPAPLRWRFDDYMRRDGRCIGSCNWLAIGSRQCLDLWRPLDIPLAEALDNIRLTVPEQNSGVMEPSHLLDDYAVSRNIARFGLKFTTIPEINERAKCGGSVFFWHNYTLSVPEKAKAMEAVLFGKPEDDAERCKQIVEVLEKDGPNASERIEAIRKIAELKMSWNLPKSLFPIRLSHELHGQ